MTNVVSIFSNGLDGGGRKGLQEVGGGLYSLGNGMAKRIKLLLNLLAQQNSNDSTRIVRGRTIKRAMEAIGRRGEKIEHKLHVLRKDPELFRLTIKIFISLVMLNVEKEKPGSHIPDERVERILSTRPTESHELDAIITILENFGMTRDEIFKTIRGETAKEIRKIEFDDVYTFLKGLRNT